MENLENELNQIYDSYEDNTENDNNVENIENVTVTEDNKNVEQKPVEENNKIVEEDSKTIQPNENIKQDITPVNNIELPRGVKTSYKDNWNSLNKEFQQELKRSFEVKDTYIKNLEEKNNLLNKAINTAEIDIQNIVNQTGLPREQVIGNMLSWVSACQIDPDNTLCNALSRGAINLRNPEGFIRHIANRYQINLNELANIDPRQASLYDENARLRMLQEAQNKQAEYQRQLQSTQGDEEIEKAISIFSLNHQEISEKINNEDNVFNSHLAYAIEKIKSSEPNNNNYLDILEKAYKLIENEYNPQINQNNVENQTQTVITNNNNTQTNNNIIKKPINKVINDTSINSSTPTSRTVKKTYNSKNEMKDDLEKELSRIYNSYNNN